jgi:hypothetical protein
MVVDELARLTGVHGPSLARVLRATASVGVFAEDQDGHFELTPLATHLRRDVPESLRDYVRLQCGDLYLRVYRGLHHSVRTGEPAVEHIFGMGAYDYLSQHPDEATLFNAAMASFAATIYRAAIAAYDFSSFATVCRCGRRPRRPPRRHLERSSTHPRHPVRTAPRRSRRRTIPGVGRAA